MLSVEDCRKHLGEDGEAMSDEQIIQFRDALYAIVEPVIDKAFDESAT